MKENQKLSLHYDLDCYFSTFTPIDDNKTLQKKHNLYSIY